MALNSTLQWNLHDLWPELTLPGGALFSKKWTTKIARRLARAEQTMRVRIARDELRRLRELTDTINALAIEIGELVGLGRPAARRPARLRRVDRRQARQRGRRPERFSATPSSPELPASRPSQLAQDAPTATASTAAATARSKEERRIGPAPSRAPIAQMHGERCARPPRHCRSGEGRH